MERQEVSRLIEQLYEECPGNTVTARDAIRPELAGLKLFDRPLVAIGAADDELFTKCKEATVVGPWFMTPQEWLGSASSVISLFFPFTEEIRSSNRPQVSEPSAQWLHGRIEGQNFLLEFIRRLRLCFEQRGSEACAPMIDARFARSSGGDNFTEYACTNENTFSSNWSERHVAYVCGLGTFGLSTSFITDRGKAGRFTSLIVSEALPRDSRSYHGVYERCTMCGACIRRCPAGAISREHGKDHRTCWKYVRKMGELFDPRFGCGLCQTNVPCECTDPSRP